LAVRFRHQGKNVTLIDTPGFDDSFTSDADILKVIAEYMGEIYSQGQLLNGLIFLQPINGNKAGGNERKRTRLFKKVLGENAYCRVIIGTTMWGNLLNDAKGVQQQEDRIKNMAIWGDMVKHGACVVRHEDTVESAMNIVEMVMDFPPVALQLQQELEKSGGNLAATSAGRQLDEDLGEVVQKLSAELEALRKDRDASREEREQLQSQLIQLREQRYSVRHAVVSFHLHCRFRHVSAKIITSWTTGDATLRSLYMIRWKWCWTFWKIRVGSSRSFPTS
jgi:hypothetical protein